MARVKNAEIDLAAVRAQIAQLAQSIGRIESEVNETRAALRKSGNGGKNGNGHHVTDDVVAGAMKFAGEAAGVTEEAFHAGASWLDDIFRKNPTPVVLTALGVGFVLGVMGRR